METIGTYGWVLVIVSVLVVFGSLTILYFIYSLIGRISSRNMSRKALPPEHSIDSSGAEAAAIAMALNLYLGEYAHDRESGAITIIEQASNWNSKDYSKK